MRALCVIGAMAVLLIGFVVNYSILGEILKKVSSKGLAKQIYESVVKPLGIKNTLYPLDTKLPGRLNGYGRNYQAKRYDDKTMLNPANSGGAGVMISTAADLQKFARQLYKGQLLKPETQKARLETQPFDKGGAAYGEGIIEAGPFWGHNGGTNGFQCQMRYLPERDASIVIAVNRCDDDLGQSISSVLTSSPPGSRPCSQKRSRGFLRVRNTSRRASD